MIKLVPGICLKLRNQPQPASKQASKQIFCVNAGLVYSSYITGVVGGIAAKDSFDGAGGAAKSRD